jgi:hypothetical protein
MPQPILEISGSAIVMLGTFNPAILQPQWFAKQELLPEEEADSANIQIIHQQVSQFETERFIFQITLDRFAAMTKPNAVDAPLRDLVAGTFYILEHTPVHAMGLNRLMHFAMHSDEAWHHVGDTLVPKKAWSDLVPGRPGMRNLQILYGNAGPGQPDVTVTVQPSVKVQPGVYFEVNYNFARQEDKGLEYLLGILKDRWEDTQRDAERIANRLLDWTAAQE